MSLARKKFMHDEQKIKTEIKNTRAHTMGVNSKKRLYVKFVDGTTVSCVLPKRMVRPLQQLGM